MSYSDYMRQNPMGTMDDYNNMANAGTGLYDSFAGMDTSSMIPTAGYDSNGYNATATNAGYDSAINKNSVGGLFDNFSAAGFSDVASGLGGLYSMYQGNKMMKLAEQDMNLRKNAYQTSRRDKDNFLSSTKSAFA